MPLDGHSYLVSQGWEGKGTGLRHGAISRPLAIPQKKNLAGLGKDRDEAFPFWDHLFTAAAKSIRVKCLSDDDGEMSGDSSSDEVSIKRTSTGIFSTKRPIEGTPATSGTITPINDECGTTTPRLSLMTIAKRDAAKRGLYSRFFRGPILGPETLAEEEKRLSALVFDAFPQKEAQGVTVIENIGMKIADKLVVADLEVSKSSRKKRKTRGLENVDGVEDKDDDDEAKRERKRRRKKERLKKEEEGEELESNRAKREEKKRKKRAKECGTGVNLEVHAEGSTWPTKGQKKQASESGDEETKCTGQRREEKKRMEALRKHETREMTVINGPTNHSKKESSSRHSSKSKVAAPEDLLEEANLKKKKKKRKRSGNPEEAS